MACKSKVLSEESIKPPATSDSSLNPGIEYTDNAKIQVKFDGSCLKQEKVTFGQKTILKFYTGYEINLWPLNLDSKFALLNSLFGAVKLLTKNADLDHYFYSGYGIGFGTCGTFSLSDGNWFGKNVIIFELILELIKVFLYMLITEREIFQFFVKVQQEN